MKKITVVILIISLLNLSMPLMAKEKRGTNLMIRCVNGQIYEGELIVVRKNSLLLLDITGRDTNVPIYEIRDVKIRKKSKMGSYALIGMALGIVIGAIVPVPEDSLKFSPRNFVVSSFVDPFRFTFSGGEYKFNRNSAMSFCGLLGAGSGAIAGGAVGFEKEISLIGKDKIFINAFLENLSLKARIKDYQ